MKKSFLFIVAMGIIIYSYSQNWAGSGVLYNNPTTTKVGIGITSPGELLHINGGALKIGNSSSAADRAVNMLKFGDGNYVRIGEWEQDDKLTFYATQGYSFTGNGDVEFKMNNSTKLRISGSEGRIYLPYNINFVFGPSWSEGTNRIRIMHSGTHGYVDYKDNLHFRADLNWISALTLYGNGSVGVGFGTTYNAGQYMNMGYKLAVNGGIICEEVKVIADVPDADYVFEEDYYLVPLPEVETFIKENKHLPNIPSAQEFKANGYKVGEMDGMLLRKIEELTLYTIEQQRLIEELQKQVKELQNVNEKGGE